MYGMLTRENWLTLICFLYKINTIKICCSPTECGTQFWGAISCITDEILMISKMERIFPLEHILFVYMCMSRVILIGLTVTLCYQLRSRVCTRDTRNPFFQIFCNQFIVIMAICSQDVFLIRKFIGAWIKTINIWCPSIV